MEISLARDLKGGERFRLLSDDDLTPPWIRIDPNDGAPVLVVRAVSSRDYKTINISPDAEVVSVGMDQHRLAIKNISIYLETITDYDSDPTDSGAYGEWTSSPDYDLIREGSSWIHRNGPGRKVFYQANYTVSQRRKDLSTIGYSKGMADFLARQQVREDYARLVSYDKGEWTHIGIRLHAKIEVGEWEMPWLQSYGVFGIESDSDPSHIFEIADDEWQQIARQLKERGVSDELIEQLNPSPLWQLPSTDDGEPIKLQRSLQCQFSNER